MMFRRFYSRRRRVISVDFQSWSRRQTAKSVSTNSHFLRLRRERLEPNNPLSSRFVHSSNPTRRHPIWCKASIAAKIVQQTVAAMTLTHQSNASVERVSGPSWYPVNQLMMERCKVQSIHESIWRYCLITEHDSLFFG